MKCIEKTAISPAGFDLTRIFYEICGLRVILPKRCRFASLFVWLWLGIGMAALPAKTVPARPPNVVIIFTDDQGYQDVGCFGSPDIKTLGIQLDVPKGLVVKEVQGAAQAAGMKAGDRIAALNGTPVWTFGDFQYRYDKVNRKAERIEITVDRPGESTTLPVALPPRWWWTDVRFRQSSVEPRPYFEDRPLTESPLIEQRRHLVRTDDECGAVAHRVHQAVGDHERVDKARAGRVHL